ncbi:MAG: Phosphoribosylformylglycinamidine cyclo-ligase [Thermotoga sp. 50_1627]|uniref:phosphoribosylformylglycinamidine cyclo-ligase n=1 Tax=Pseudothermotoga sp. TaxID=2033661 RepID=UPI00076C795F|nr:MAG: Phosphoribosylformylglycinamidine cyclo-ligase [Thermotoga sp. 50_64]KUK24169.1 MAG: Phosphoribosylformylglycinamidine cyclo-ligase [Thermotoga sp. 50_1627]MDK2923471.1 phosphoribosylformylglycinamidine cyclo-ligase [Pseudothermotoga sp.]HBT38842.1 phosphoribosylformylglycinamidine cyclo-ligase [Pseudothermotoga sp.]HCO98538.1 phosphoribosylformylglycinamidine cyclo-ligase [Pseudothermotoga sp.]
MRSYKEAGVDQEAADESVERIKRLARLTYVPQVLGGIGSFGGFFELPSNYRQPVLVASTDGVGTKLKIAFMMDKHDTVGIDCVAMCVNDVLVHAAKPLFFLDYLAVGKLKVERVEQIVSGIAKGCVEAGCALIGGETAQMPDFYGEDEYDLAGFAVGIVEKDQLLDGSKVSEGDLVLGLASSGLHSNGFSLARKILLSHYRVDSYVDELGRTIGEEMLTPTKIYVKSVLKVLDGSIHAMAHITGGGIPGNLPRVIPTGLEARIDKNSWPVPTIFSLIQRLGMIDESEMFRTFNMGIGFMLIVERDSADRIATALKNLGEEAWLVGEIRRGERRIVL